MKTSFDQDLDLQFYIIWSWERFDMQCLAHSDSRVIQQAVARAQVSSLPDNSALSYGYGRVSEKIVDHLCVHA